MTPPSIRILFVEDDPVDAVLTERLLSRVGPESYSFTPVRTLQEALALLRTEDFDVILLDLSLPDSFGVEAVSALRAVRPLVPVVVLTGNDDESMPVKAMQEGAQDYLVKDPGNADLVRRSIKYAIERSRAEATLRRSEGRFRAIFENAGLGIGLVDNDGHLFSVNPALRAMLPPEPAPPGPRRLSNHVHPDDRAGLLDRWHRLLNGIIEHATVELRFVGRAKTIWGRVTLSLVTGPGRVPLFTVALVEDVSLRKEAEERQRLAAKVLEATGEGIFVTDAEGRIVHVNPAFTRLTGFGPGEVLGRTPSVLSSGRHPPEFFRTMWEMLKTDGIWRGEVWNRRKNGEIFAVWMNVSAVRDERGQTGHYVAVFSDITSQKENEERLSYLANHDALTGLPNRALFIERLERSLLRAERGQHSLAVLFLDLDHFKEINDTLGHLAGDALLQQVAERLYRTVRRQDTVARQGGDEFTLLLEDVDGPADAATVASKILRRLGVPFALPGGSRPASASIGIALFPRDGRNVEALLRCADEAMYQAKKQGRSSFRFASPELARQAEERPAMARALSEAVDNGQLELFFQPVVDLAKGGVGGVETLLRWHHPELGLMVPADFLGIAGDTGLMGPIGRWVADTAIVRFKEWSTENPGDLRLCVNVARTEILRPAFAAGLLAQLLRIGVPPGMLDIDVPAELIVEGEVRAVIQSLRTAGIRVSMDGFSPRTDLLAFLENCRIDAVKIDPGHIRGIGRDPAHEDAIRSAVRHAHRLGARAIAKGVETLEQRAFLESVGCDAAQGYFLGPPVPGQDIPAILLRGEEGPP